MGDKICHESNLYRRHANHEVSRRPPPWFFSLAVLGLSLTLASCGGASKTSEMSPPSASPTASSTNASAALFIDDGGQNEELLPVVFLHSSGGSTEHFAAQLAHVRQTRRALAVDLPGHGKSPRATTFEIPEVAEVALAALTAHGVERFVVVGHSWGGAVAAAMAGAAPERVAGLLLLDPASDGHLMPKDVADGLMESLRTNYDAVLGEYWASMLVEAKPEVKERLMAEIRAVPREVVTGTLASLLTFDPLPALKRYHGPKRALITELNERPDAYHRLADDVASTKVTGVGHWLQLDKPEVVNAALDAFFVEMKEIRTNPPRL